MKYIKWIWLITQTIIVSIIIQIPITHIGMYMGHSQIHSQAFALFIAIWPTILFCIYKIKKENKNGK